MLRALTITLVLAGATTGRADDVPPEVDPGAQPMPEAPEVVPPAPGVHPLATPGDWDEPAAWQPPAPFRASVLAEEPNWGDALPSRGYPHYDVPTRHYGHWHRPTAFGRGPAERCAPAIWNPRGHGNLFARSSAHHRMDYTPYALATHESRQGPAYHAQPVDYCCGTPLLSRIGCRCCDRCNWFDRLLLRVRD